MGGFNQPKRFRWAHPVLVHLPVGPREGIHFTSTWHPQPGASWILGEASRILMNYEGFTAVHYLNMGWGPNMIYDLYGIFIMARWFDIAKLWIGFVWAWGIRNTDTRNWRTTIRFGVAYFRQIGQLLYDMYMMLHSHQQHFSLALKQSHESVKRWFNRHPPGTCLFGTSCGKA